MARGWRLTLEEADGRKGKIGGKFEKMRKEKRSVRGRTVDDWIIDEHLAKDWDVERTWLFEVGFDALEVEEMVLDQWRNLLGLRQRLSPNQMPQGGASETAPFTPGTLCDTLEVIDSWIAHLQASRLTNALSETSSIAGAKVIDFYT